MNLIVDANILFSALYKPDSRAGALLMFSIEEKVSLLSTEHIYIEMMRICKQKLEYSDSEAWDVINHLPVEWIETEIYHERMSGSLILTSDEGDASLLALSSLTGYPIVTGDKGLLSLHRKEGYRILDLASIVDGPR